MSRIADLADTTATPSDSAANPTADWGDNLADWHSISDFLQSPPNRNGRVTLTYPSEMIASLQFTHTTEHNLFPGDGTFSGTIDLVNKRIAFEVEEKWYYIDALTSGLGAKQVMVRPAKTLPPNGPTPWVAEEWGPPGSGE